jgi:hypothetical protein
VRARRVYWKGHTYPTIGWALGDVLLAFPLASDQQVAEWLNVTPQTICLWRHRVGIAEYRIRHQTNPYKLRARLARCVYCCRAWRLKPAQVRRKCPGCQRVIELTAIEVREAGR